MSLQRAILFFYSFFLLGEVWYGKIWVVLDTKKIHSSLPTTTTTTSCTSSYCTSSRFHPADRLRPKSKPIHPAIHPFMKPNNGRDSVRRKRKAVYKRIRVWWVGIQVGGKGRTKKGGLPLFQRVSRPLSSLSDPLQHRPSHKNQKSPGRENEGRKNPRSGKDISSPVPLPFLSSNPLHSTPSLPQRGGNFFFFPFFLSSLDKKKGAILSSPIAAQTTATRPSEPNPRVRFVLELFRLQLSEREGE